MDSNLSDLIGGILSNPEMLSKVMTFLPIVTQMMSSDNSSNKIVETTAVQNEQPLQTVQSNPISQSGQINQGQTPENLMANENVMTAFKNLIAALNSAGSANTVNSESAPPPPAQSASQNISPNISDAITALANMTAQNNQNNQNSQNIQNPIENNSNNTGSQANQSNTSNNSNSSNSSNTIEKTLDTLKNISSATSPESDHRAKLLLALKPFLKDTRQTKIDTAIKYINAAKIFSMFGKNGFV